MSKVIRRGASFVFALILIISIFSISASAKTRIDTTATGTLTLKYPVSDVEFKLYKVADISDAGRFTLTKTFSGYSIYFDQEDQSEWNLLAETLSAYVARDNITASASDTVNALGKVKFRDLELGLYLVEAKEHTYENKKYTPQPFLISVPNLDDDDEWTYSFEVEPKYEVADIPETVTRRVHKAWDDSSDTSSRPSSIQVQLLQDGEVVDTVTLNEKNSWSYEWTELEADHCYQVTEKTVPTNYTVKQCKQGTTFLITNTLNPTQPTTKPQQTTVPTTTKPSPSKLPQTGVLWWPVPVLAFVGIVVLAIGIRVKIKNKNEK